MILASTLANDSARPRSSSVRSRNIALDGVLLAGFAAMAAALFFEGGLEALIGASAGAILGARGAVWPNARLPSAISGAFAGLFAGALFAGFFHGALVNALSAVT